MLARFDPDDDIVATIAARILTVIRPWRVVLFGSRARGDAKPHSDYDVYVEVDPGTSTLKQIHGDLHHLFAGPGVFVDLKLHEPGTIERRRHDPGTIEWDVAREGRVLYAHPDASAVIAQMPGIDGDCDLLTKHAITPRYPQGNDLGEEDGRVAYAAAERVVAAVEGELPRSVH
jgi:predicted nucleotidyltransferase